MVGALERNLAFLCCEPDLNACAAHPLLHLIRHFDAHGLLRFESARHSIFAVQKADALQRELRVPGRIVVSLPMDLPCAFAFRRRAREVTTDDFGWLALVAESAVFDQHRVIAKAPDGS